MSCYNDHPEYGQPFRLLIGYKQTGYNCPKDSILFTVQSKIIWHQIFEKNILINVTEFEFNFNMRTS